MCPRVHSNAQRVKKESYIFFMCSDLLQDCIEMKHLTIYTIFLQKALFVLVVQQNIVPLSVWL